MNLTGLKKKPAAGKKTYPALSMNDELTESVNAICEIKQKIEQLDGMRKIHEAKLKGAAVSHAFAGREAPGTVKAQGDTGSVSITCTSRYYGIAATQETDQGESENPRISALRKLMGDRFETDMEREVTVSVDLNKFDPQYRDEIIQQLVGISEMYDNSEGIVAKEQYKPIQSFHLNRCRDYTEEQNHEINRHLPMTVMLRAKS